VRKNFIHRKAKAKEKPKRTRDSAQCKSKDPDLKNYIYTVFSSGCWFISLSTKALREQKRDETTQAWRQKTLRMIKLKIS
jgi:hypothetical protein